MDITRIHKLLDRFFSNRGDVLDWGVAPAGPSQHSDSVPGWVRDGLHGGLAYMERTASQRVDPKSIYPWAKSTIMFAHRYPSRLLPHTAEAGMAAYAKGEDYHYLCRRILEDLDVELRQATANFNLEFTGFTDTAPVFERGLGREAGLGWAGKNCMLIHPVHGSAFFLAGCFVNIDLMPSKPIPSKCGKCTKCMDACPTGALTAPGRLDCGKCISYWTIENKGQVPPELADKFGSWFFGCDVCQSVCPWNRKHLENSSTSVGNGTSVGNVATDRLMPDPGHMSDPGRLHDPGRPHDLASINKAQWTTLLTKGGGFKSRFKYTPLTRAGRKMILRNLRIAATNNGDDEFLEKLNGVK